MENLVTVDTIIRWFSEQIEQKNPISPNLWLDASLKLNVLLQGVQENLFEVEQKVAGMRQAELIAGKPASHAKILVEASDEYKQARILKAKIDRCIELIRLAKQYSRLSQEQLLNQ